MGAREGLNGFGDAAYGGPCPPPGDAPHRYEFVVFAVEGASTVDLGPAPPLDEVLDAITCCITASGRTTATYER